MTKNKLNALKDYLELIRNFMFGNGLLVTAGSVVRDRAAIGNFAAQCIVCVLVCASNVENRNKPETPTHKQAILRATRTATLFVLIEAILNMVDHHVDRENRIERGLKVDMSNPTGLKESLSRGRISPSKASS